MPLLSMSLIVSLAFLLHLAMGDDNICLANETAAEVDEFLRTCQAMAPIYNGPYESTELLEGIAQACSQDGCGATFNFLCAKEYNTTFCKDQAATVSAITVAEAFDCLFQDEEACSKKAYCNYTEVLGSFVCAPLLKEESIQGVIQQTCSEQDPETVKQTYIGLAEKKGQDRDRAALDVAFALELYCGKDENGEDYFPDNCPCNFGEFTKLHTYSNMVADGFGKAPLVCVKDATGRRMKRAFSVNTATVAEWHFRRQFQENRKCLGSNNGQGGCTQETQALGKAMKYKKSALATLNGMCVTDPNKNGTEAFCMHNLKTMPLNAKKCFIPLVMGKTSVCTDECDQLLAPIIEKLTGSCCVGTLQEAFSFHGNPDTPFLYALSACTNTSTFISETTIGAEKACPGVVYDKADSKDFCLPLEWSKVKSFQDLLTTVLAEEMARAMGMVPEQVTITLYETESCKFDSGASAVTVKANFQYDDELANVELASVTKRTAVGLVLEDNGCQDCLEDVAIQFTTEGESGASSLTTWLTTAALCGIATLVV